MEVPTLPTTAARASIALGDEAFAHVAQLPLVRDVERPGATEAVDVRRVRPACGRRSRGRLILSVGPLRTGDMFAVCSDSQSRRQGPFSTLLPITTASARAS
jgi:hypothetical protein